MPISPAESRIATLLLFGLLWSVLLGVGPGASRALAACPTSNSSYGHSSPGSNSVGIFNLRWIRIGEGVSSAPCDKGNVTDSNPPNDSHCVEGIFDWEMVPQSHYDSRVLISCHEGANHQLLKSEREANWGDIDRMRFVAECYRSGGQSGTRTGCTVRIDLRGTPEESLGNIPTSPNQFSDFWIWNSNGVLNVYDN